MSTHQPIISIVSPVYKAEAVITDLVDQIDKSLTHFDYEIVLVEDHSPDSSWKKIQDIASSNPRIKAIKLSRNFGQHAAITAGLRHVTGEWVVVMDCDLQDKPQEIPNLYKKAQEGYDIVQAKRKIRYDGFFKKLSSKLFYYIFEKLSGLRQDHTIANFGIYHKKVIKAFNEFNEPLRSFPSIINWLGFHKTSLDVVHGENSELRASSYSLKTLLRLGFDIIISYSNKPLHITITIGIFISLIGFGLGLFYLIRYAIMGTSVSGFTTIISSLWFLSGIIIISLGIVGIYISSIFDTVKNRPLFVVEKKIGFDDED